MKILVACEFSGVVRDEFEKTGHDVWSCDLLPTEKEGNHIQGDVLDILDNGWDMMIAHPPCTYLCNSGVRWLHTQDGRWQQMQKAALFFKTLFDAPIPRIAVENPVMHKYAKELIGENYTQTFQPWEFGHGETKRTCLWLKGLPPLQPTNIVEGREQRVHKLSPSKDRWKLRSITYQGVAQAMANQWGTS